MPSPYDEHISATRPGLIDFYRKGFHGTPLVKAAAGVTLISGACVSGANAFVLTGMMAILLPLVAVIVSVERRRNLHLSPPARPFVYGLITTLAVFGLSLLLDRVIFPGSVSALGIYAPLLAFDGLVLFRVGESLPRVSPADAVAESLGTILSFGAVALPVAVVREVLGSGRLLSLNLGFDGAPAFRSPFAGFILCGIALAVFRQVHSKNKETRGTPGAVPPARNHLK